MWVEYFQNRSFFFSAEVMLSALALHDVTDRKRMTVQLPAGLNYMLHTRVPPKMNNGGEGSLGCRCFSTSQVWKDDAIKVAHS